ncbi:AI-2E family transporter [Nitrosomonas ureae]|uniref:Predicted PurR-regulated permease PerM n=1 Tax=Nitrosomonas ureae TaxID=44577 RepID=A0A0S3AG75_9PROT|nr:AI-2E family transporter [Nitrosomonas ureae]ALQ50172.1 ABC transporter permease [Nitrosomonas ureae]PTQ88778.1 putative PurR-regulated permease PerM [Nitrosomonas ureae]SDT85291.1 Predicted PurR-regulated permease PerM [Nitrosomonas ureae]SEQ51971.1 Predicted PurR-regulated permease PerM [Nitrosomonas ureae]
MNTEYSGSLHYLWWLLLACVAGGLIYLLSPILTPFLLAAVIAYICNPMVSYMADRKIPRTVGAVLVMLLLLGVFAALILIMVPLFEKEANRLLDKMPAYLDMLKNHVIPWLESRLDISLQPDMNVLKEALSEHWKSAGGVAAKMLPSLTSGGMAVVEFLVNLLLVPVVLFYLLRDWDMLVKLIDEMIPRYWHDQISQLARETDRILAEFLRGQLSVILLMSICYITGLWLAGLEFALPIGLVAGILVFVPYLGMIVGLMLATFAAMMQFQDWSGVITVWAVFGIGQMLEGMLITPWLVGDRIGLHPVVVIFALMAFGQLFGFFGILLALPVSAVMLVWLRHLRQRYLGSDLYNS